MSKYHIGIDLGGTKSEIAILDEAREIIFRNRINTDAHKGSSHILSQIFTVYQLAVNHIKNAEHSLGMGTPGSLSAKTDLLRNSNTLCLNGLPLNSLVEQKLNTQLAVENDPNCFTLAAALKGAATNFKLGFGIVIGDG